MRTPRIVDAINYIDDDLVSWAVEYRRVPLSARLFHKPFLKACACFLVIALIFGVAFFRGNGNKEISSPFILTVYAMSPDDGSITGNVLAKGKQVPISRFETESGLTGFVVSYNKPDDSLPSSIIIIAADSNSQNRITEISSITNDPTQNYYFYIPGENEIEPYSLPLFLTDTEENLICQYKVIITQVDGNYYAELVEENIMERVTK